MAIPLQNGINLWVAIDPEVLREPPWPSALPDASQMSPRCLPDVSQMPPRCLPDDSPMPPDTSRCLPDISQVSRRPIHLNTVDLQSMNASPIDLFQFISP